MPPTTRAGSPIRTHGRRTSTVWSAIWGGWRRMSRPVCRKRMATRASCSCSAVTARPTQARWPASGAHVPGSGSGLHGSTRTATSTRRTRHRRATSGACRSRWPAGEATRGSWRRPRGHRSGAGRGPVRRSGARRDGVADARRERGRAIRPGDAGAIRLGRQPRPRGRPACRAASTRGTSRSTWMRLDASGNWAIAMPEPDGLTLGTAATAVRAIATSGAPVIGFGATAMMEREGADLGGTVRGGRGTRGGRPRSCGCGGLDEASRAGRSPRRPGGTSPRPSRSRPPASSAYRPDRRRSRSHRRRA